VGFSAGFGASNIDLLAVTDKFVLAVCFDISGICLEFGADTFRLASSFIIFLILDCCFGIGDGIIFGEEDNVGEDDIVCGDDNDELDDIVCEDDIIGRGGLIDDLFEDLCASLDKVMGEVAAVAESVLDIVADADSSCGCVLSDWVLFSSVCLVRNDVLNGWISSGDDRGRLDVSALVSGLRSKVVVVVLDDSDDVIVVMGIVEVVVVVVVVVVTVVVVVIDVVVIIGGGAVGAVVIITVVVVVSTL